MQWLTTSGKVREQQNYNFDFETFGGGATFLTEAPLKCKKNRPIAAFRFRFLFWS